MKIKVAQDAVRARSIALDRKQLGIKKAQDAAMARSIALDRELAQDAAMARCQRCRWWS